MSVDEAVGKILAEALVEPDHILGLRNFGFVLGYKIATPWANPLAGYILALKTGGDDRFLARVRRCAIKESPEKAYQEAERYNDKQGMNDAMTALLEQNPEGAYFIARKQGDEHPRIEDTRDCFSHFCPERAYYCFKQEKDEKGIERARKELSEKYPNDSSSKLFKTLDLALSTIESMKR